MRCSGPLSYAAGWPCGPTSKTKTSNGLFGLNGLIHRVSTDGSVELWLWPEMEQQSDLEVRRAKVVVSRPTR